MRKFTGAFLAFFVFCYTCFFVSDVCRAEERAYKILFVTLDDAVKRALETNLDIKLADLDVDRAREVMDYAWDAHNKQLINTYQPTSQLYISLPPDRDAFPFMMKSNRGYHIQKKIFEIKKDALTLNVKRSYYDVLMKRKELLMLESALKKAEYEYMSAKVKKDAEMAADVELMSAISAVESAEAEVGKKRAELENAKKDFCEITGLPIGANIVLVDDLSFEEIEIPSLCTAVAFATSLEHNPYLWILKEQYELQCYIWSYTQPDEAGKIDKEKLYIEYKKGRLNIEKKMHTVYENLMSLEKAHKSAETALLTAKKALKTAKIMQKNGMVTEIDVLKREADVKKAEVVLLKTAYNYELAKETFLKPWLLADLETKA